jgi:hypothetical protein
MSESYYGDPDPDATQVHHLPGYWPPAEMARGHRRLPRQNDTPPAPAAPAPYHYERSLPEIMLEVVMRVIVIITCLVILFVIWRGYVALSALGDSLQQLQDGWNGATGG